MKRVFALILILAVSVIAFERCSDKNPDPAVTASMLHNDYAKLWVLSEIWTNGVKGDIATQKDEHLLLTKNQTGMLIFGEVDTQPGDTLTCDNFDWALSADGKNILFTDFHNNNLLFDYPEMEIYSITSDKVEFHEILASSSSRTASKFIFIPAVKSNSNASANNKLLTQGNIKIWITTGTSIDGEVQVNACRRDDFYVFGTDGTSIKVFGDLHCIPGDTANNDFIKWTFIENETRIMRTEVNPTWNHTGGQQLNIGDTMNILKLTDTEFIYEVTNRFDGVTKKAVITNVPLVK